MTRENDRETRKLISKFKKRCILLLRPKHRDIISDVMPTTLVMVEWDRRGRKRDIEEEWRRLIAAGRNPNEPCIQVSLKNPLPRRMTIPKIFEGVTVFARCFRDYRAY